MMSRSSKLAKDELAYHIGELDRLRQLRYVLIVEGISQGDKRIKAVDEQISHHNVSKDLVRARLRQMGHR